MPYPEIHPTEDEICKKKIKTHAAPPDVDAPGSENPHIVTNKIKGKSSPDDCEMDDTKEGPGAHLENPNEKIGPGYDIKK